jgi:hypothetical protein
MRFKTFKPKEASMKGKILLIAITIFIALFGIISHASAQIGIIWQQQDSLRFFLGAANMDNDAADELVYYNNAVRICIRDGLTGAIEWDSGTWSSIRISGYDMGGDYGFSPFCDINGDGKKEITFIGRHNSTDPERTYIVGLGGTGFDDGNSPNVPNPFNLNQNYPNPFNPNTTINYQITVSAHTTITVYNILGQTVRTLVNEDKKAGDYLVIWDGRNDNGETVASGAYFYQLRAGDYISTKKSLLLK